MERFHKGNDATDWAAFYAIGALAAEEKIAFEQHLRSGCEICSLQLRTFERAADQLAAEASAVPPAALRERLLTRVREEVALAAIHHKAPGILFQHAGLLISRSSDLPWEPAPIPGLSSRTLFVDPARKYATSLVRMEFNSVYPSHRHHDIEEVFLIEGDLTVEGVHMGPGDYCRSEPGTIHGESRTQQGNVLLIFTSQQDELLG